MSLKSLSDLSVTVQLYDSTTANPTSSQVGASTGKVIISYWRTENGDWNGVYELGICCKYGEQEGPIYVHETEQIGLIDEILNFQVYITTGGATRAMSAAHILGDDRIDGLTIYFRPYGEEEWRLLQEVDLKSGGKHNWQLYDTDKSAYGIFPSNGTLVLNTPAETTEDGVDGQYAYKQTTTSIVINNQSANGFSGRAGFLRLYGFAIQPIYARLSSLDSQTVSGITVINPKTGTSSLYCELLDENFNRLKKSASISVSYTDKGYAPPPREDGVPSD